MIYASKLNDSNQNLNLIVDASTQIANVIDPRNGFLLRICDRSSHSIWSDDGEELPSDTQTH